MKKKMSVWIVGVGFATLVIGILILGYQSPKGIKPIHWIAIAAVFSGVAILFKEISSSESNQSIKETGERNEQKLKELEDQNRELLARNDSLSTKQIELLSKINHQETTIDTFRKENNELSFKLSGQVLESLNSGTGGDSKKNYPYLSFYDNVPTGELYVALFGGNSFPVYGINIIIVESPDSAVINQTVKEKGLTATSALYQDLNYYEQEISPNSSKTISKFKPVNTDTYFLTCLIVARNGAWRQEFAITKDSYKSTRRVTCKMYAKEANNKDTLIGEFDSNRDGSFFKLRPPL